VLKNAPVAIETSKAGVFREVVIALAIVVVSKGWISKSSKLRKEISTP
jgi:hypothetical protein